MKCECPYTLKVPLGNAFQVLFPVKTAEWKDGERTVEVADVRALTDIVVKVDGDEWQDWEMDERGPLVNFPKDSLAKGPHNVEITADYFGVAIRAAYFECITMVQWSYESNIGNYIIGSPLVAEAAYIYVGITDDEELEQLKQQYRDATAACETARLQYEAAKEEFDEKAEQLDDVAQQTTLVEGIASVLQGFAPLATTAQLNTVAQNILTAISHIDIDTTTLAKEQTLTNGIQSILTALNPKATTADVTAAKQAILDALSHISPEDPYSRALAQFFGLPQALPEIELATEQEVKDINDDVMGALYGYGKVTVTIHSLMRTGAETTQDLASVIYVDPEKTWAENGYPTLYDDEGEPIDTTTNPAAGDEVFNYQIQSES